MAMALMLQELDAQHFNSGAAPAGAVLTADGNGGAAWVVPAASGGSGDAVVPFLGNVGQEDTPATYDETWDAYEAVTGHPLHDGAIAALIDNGGPEFQVLAFWHEQRLRYRLNLNPPLP